METKKDLLLVKFNRGSRAYGTHNDNSDYDSTEIYLEDIYTKALLFRKYKHNDRFNIKDNSRIELGLAVDRFIAGDTAYIESCFRDLVIEETPYTNLYFEMVDEMIENDLFNRDILLSRAKKHFKDESKRINKVLSYGNTEKSTKLLYQNLRVELLLNSILEGTPKLVYIGEDLDYLKSIKYGSFTVEELLILTKEFNDRWVNVDFKHRTKERDVLLDNIYVSYLRKFDDLRNDRGE